MTLTTLAAVNGHTAPVPVVPAPAAPTTVGGAMAVADVHAWLERASVYRQLAEGLVHSAFVPAAYRTGPVEVAIANVVGAMMQGGAMGLDPLTSIQQVYIVHGRPGMYARAKVALALSRGHRVWASVRSADRAVVHGLRRGAPEDQAVTVEITMADAERAGWAKGNAAYQKTPADMLWARAASRVVDQIAADDLHGIASVEDLGDHPDPAPARVRVTAEDLPAAPARAQVEVPVVDLTGGPITTAAWTRINAALVGLGVTGPGRAARCMAIIERIVGRPLTRGSDLTVAEGEEVQRVLSADGADALIAAILDADQPQPQPVAEAVAEAVVVEDPPADPWDLDGADAVGEGA